MTSSSVGDIDSTRYNRDRLNIAEAEALTNFGVPDNIPAVKRSTSSVLKFDIPDIVNNGVENAFANYISRNLRVVPIEQ
jgi:hypothetical protein